MMGIDSCVHIPMDCEDTKKRNMSKRSSTRKQLWSRSHCMQDLFSSPTLMKFNAIKNMLNFFSTKDIYMHQHIACWVKGEKRKN